MRYSLLNHLACQGCGGRLVAAVARECLIDFPVGLFPEAQRVNADGQVVGPAPAWRRATDLTGLLERLAGPAAGSEADGRRREITDGILVCGECGRWYPVMGLVPEVLPDHLREWGRDRATLESLADRLPGELLGALRRYVPQDGGVDGGLGYKQAEITIAGKVDDPHFFEPGLSSPFNPWDPDHTLHLLRFFASALPLLELKRGEVVVDTGCGYAWTTEWLTRSGFEAVGVDICRTYVDVGLRRMASGLRPHLVIGDVENLPIAASAATAVLGFESFHHVPDRKRAMQGFARVLQPGGRVVLAEPDGAHEHAKVSVDVMEKYGILEKGMDLADVEDYVTDSGLGVPEQLFVVRVPSRLLDPGFARQHSGVVGNIFRVPLAAPPTAGFSDTGGEVRASPASSPSAPGGWAGVRTAVRRLRARLRPGSRP